MNSMNLQRGDIILWSRPFHSFQSNSSKFNAIAMGIVMNNVKSEMDPTIKIFWVDIKKTCDENTVIIERFCVKLED